MNNQRWISRNFFVFFISWGIFLPYWTGWLVDAKGLSVAEASLIMGFGLVARGAFSLTAFPIASKYWSSKKVFLLLTIGSLVATILYIPSSSFTALFIVTFLFSAVYPAMLPAIDSMASTLVHHGNVHYGKSRSYGSFGYIVTVMIMSVITGYFGDQAILWSMIVALGFVMLMNMLPAPDVLLIKPTEKERKESIKMSGLWQTKSFPIVLIVVILLQGAHASYYNYGYIYLQDLGVAKYYIGIILNIAVIFEIIYFMKSDHMFKQWKPSSLLLLSAAGSTLRWILIYAFPNMWVFIVSQSLHALSFGVAHYAFILYMTKNLPKHQISNAQGVYSAFALSWSTAIWTMAGGFIYEITPRLSFLAMIVCTIPALILILVTRKAYNY